MTAVVNQSRPESRGSIHIASADPAAHPEIRPNYLATDLDRRTLLAGLRLLLRIFGAPALAPYVTGRLAPEPALDTDSDDALMAYVRADANTVYHPTSTCSIGKVVDPQLAVVGVEGLYVADASVMPKNLYTPSSLPDTERQCPVAVDLDAMPPVTPVTPGGRVVA
jgi:choline dehydrogenase